MPAAALPADLTRDAIAAADALRAKSVPLLLAERARAEPAGIAYRAKHLGIYRERTWRDYAEQVVALRRRASRSSACARATASRSWATPPRNG